jgi:hypothetical protein
MSAGYRPFCERGRYAQQDSERLNQGIFEVGAALQDGALEFHALAMLIQATPDCGRECGWAAEKTGLVRLTLVLAEDGGAVGFIATVDLGFCTSRSMPRKAIKLSFQSVARRLASACATTLACCHQEPNSC